MDQFSNGDSGSAVRGKLNALLNASAGVIDTRAASGSSVTTTGGITIGQASLVVASATSFAVGQGILVKGAGTSGAHLVTTISAIAGTTITLAANAASTVAGAVVQHDDAAAINTALAAAYNGGGGTVMLAPGWYRCNKPLAAATNSVLTFPQDITYSLTPVSVALLGSGRGRLNITLDSSAVASASGTPPAGGVVLDFRDAPTGSGNYPAMIAGAPYILEPNGTFSGFNNLDLHVDGMTLLTKANSTLTGINAGNCLRLSVGDKLSIVSIDATGTFAQPTHGNIGIFWPQQSNNIGLDCGAVQIFGFGVGMRAGEHLHCRRPYMAFCAVGFEIPFNYHLISGNLAIENSIVQIAAAAGNTQGFIDLVLEGESTGGAWQTTTAGIYDPSNVLRGRLAYCHFVFGATDAFIITGATGVTLFNLRGAPIPPASTWTLESGYVEVSASALNSTPPANTQAYIAQKIAADAFSGDVQLTANFVWSASGSATQRQIALLARGASVAPWSGASCYYAILDSGTSPGASIGKQVAGSSTGLTSSVNPGDLSPTAEYKMVFTVKATALTLAIQRVSDSKWLTSGGTWQVGAANVAAVTDTTFAAAAGTYGLLAYANTAAGPAATITNFGIIAAP